jgi:uncharacterized SAM-binding protein YcdF (DUF218 family)
MSTRWPAQVNRTAVTPPEGTVSRLRGRRLLIVLGILVAAWLATALVLFAAPHGDTAPKRADVVVVLSGARDERLDPALRLVRSRVAPTLAISGVAHDPKWEKARFLCGHGATGFRVVCFSPRPYSTQGEARTIARLARANGWHRIVVVTSGYHVFRARMLFERCLPSGDRLWVVAAGYPLLRLPAELVTESGKLFVQETFQRGC